MPYRDNQNSQRHNGLSLFARAKAALVTVNFGKQPHTGKPVECEYRNNFGYEAAYVEKQHEERKHG